MYRIETPKGIFVFEEEPVPFYEDIIIMNLAEQDWVLWGNSAEKFESILNSPQSYPARVSAAIIKFREFGR